MQSKENRKKERERGGIHPAEVIYWSPQHLPTDRSDAKSPPHHRQTRPSRLVSDSISGRYNSDKDELVPNTACVRTSV